MIKPDFNPDGNGMNNWKPKGDKVTKAITELTSVMAKYVDLQKQQLLEISLIELEGKVPSREEYMKHAVVHKRGPSDEMVVWKGKPLLWLGAVEIKEDESGRKYPSIEYKFMYTVDDFKDEENGE